MRSFRALKQYQSQFAPVINKRVTYIEFDYDEPDSIDYNQVSYLFNDYNTITEYSAFLKTLQKECLNKITDHVNEIPISKKKIEYLNELEIELERLKSKITVSKDFKMYKCIGAKVTAKLDKYTDEIPMIYPDKNKISNFVFELYQNINSFIKTIQLFILNVRTISMGSDIKRESIIEYRSSLTWRRNNIDGFLLIAALHQMKAINNVDNNLKLTDAFDAFGKIFNEKTKSAHSSISHSLAREKAEFRILNKLKRMAEVPSFFDEIGKAYEKYIEKDKSKDL